MALKGDFAKLHKMVLKVQRLGQPEALQDLSDNLAEEAVDLVKGGFAAETDPYGKRWPNKVFGDGRQVLVGRSQQLRGGWHRTRLDHKGFRISPSKSAPYAKYHQGGTGIFGPRRSPIVPVRAKILRFTAYGKTSKGDSTQCQRLPETHDGPAQRRPSAGMGPSIRRVQSRLVSLVLQEALAHDGHR
jgi:hypothetical protein